MRPFQYHAGQREIQEEANSIKAADKLATWVGPVSDYANEADLIVLACADATDVRVAALSGPPPLAAARAAEDGISVALPLALTTLLPADRPWGGIVINPATARRSRVAGHPQVRGAHVEIPCTVAFTNCRKYMTPTSSTGSAAHVGPTAEVPVGLDDAWLVDTVRTGETAFLLTVTPDGVADASHRGGPPGFLRYDAERPSLAWTEYLGDGMFVSTGNVRRTSHCALVVLDYDLGDAVRLDGTARYTNARRDRHERVDALLQADEPFPVQGSMELTVTRATRLRAFCLPRVRVARRSRITSADTTAVQHPQ